MPRNLFALLALFCWIVPIVAQVSPAASAADKAQSLLVRGASFMEQKQPEQAEPLFRQAVGFAPENPLAHYYLASAEMSLNKYAAATESAAKALQIDSAVPGLARKQRREVTDILGLACAAQKDFPKALSVYKEAVAKDPKFPGFPYNLACVSALSGDRDGALSALRAALVTDKASDNGPTLPDAATDEDLKGLWGDPVFMAILIANQGQQPNDGAGGGLGREGARKMASGDMAGAAETLRAALEADPNLVRGWFLLGGALEGQGKTAEASVAFRKALSLNAAPRAILSKATIRLAALASGRDFLASGKFEEALAAFKVAEGADAFNASVHYELARTYAGLGDRPNAEASLKKAFALKDTLLPLEKRLPDPASDPAFSLWRADKGWKELVGSL